MYNVVEKFVSINGESKFAGQLAVFAHFVSQYTQLRLQPLNLINTK